MSPCAHVPMCCASPCRPLSTICISAGNSYLQGGSPPATAEVSPLGGQGLSAELLGEAGIGLSPEAAGQLALDTSDGHVCPPGQEHLFSKSMIEASHYL